MTGIRSGESRNLPFSSKAVLSILPVIGFRPDLIHCHDWQAGLIPVYLDNFRYMGEYYRGIKTVMTIHNLEIPRVYGIQRPSEASQGFRNTISYRIKWKLTKMANLLKAVSYMQTK